MRAKNTGRALKIRVYKVIRRPVVLYGCKTWTMTWGDATITSSMTCSETSWQSLNQEDWDWGVHDPPRVVSSKCVFSIVEPPCTTKDHLSLIYFPMFYCVIVSPYPYMQMITNMKSSTLPSGVVPCSHQVVFSFSLDAAAKKMSFATAATLTHVHHAIADIHSEKKVSVWLTLHIMRIIEQNGRMWTINLFILLAII